ncbi:phosphotransferase family protein [Nocardioides pacificus]
MPESSVVPKGAEAEIKTTELDLDQVAPLLAAWIGDQVGADATPQVRSLRRPEHSGMSSISVLVDVAWTEAGEGRSAELVARLAPEDSAFPVFPTYDLQRQYDVMRQVRARSSLPVPQVRWVEPSGEVLGVPFLVMDRASGRAPVDNPPYVFDGWLLDLDRPGQQEVQRASVQVLAQLHSIPDPASVVAPLPGEPAASHLRRHVDQERDYYEWTRRTDGLRIPVLERAFDWLERHWPADLSPDVVCWGGCSDRQHPLPGGLAGRRAGLGVGRPRAP